MMISAQPAPTGPSAALFGAPGTNLNLGLNALMRATLAAAHSIAPGVRFTVFDGRLGVRRSEVQLADGSTLPFDVVGARRSRRVTRPESFAAMTGSLAVGGRGNPGARAVLQSDVVLDVSGGDSFSDIYGSHRFRSVCAPKRFALRARRPLVLLPQTYGPFDSPTAARTATELVRGSAQAWARDPDSYAVLAELLGDEFNPDTHRLGVDLAVLLPPSPQIPPLDSAVQSALGRAPVGINVSGLLWNDAGRFGLRADYRTAMRELVERLVERDRTVILVPHVLGRQTGQEADNVAGDELRSLMPSDWDVHNIDWFEHAGDAKAVIARMDYFVATRMHTAIAALSAGVPSSAIAYSPKYAGVLDTFHVRDLLLDARALDTTELVELCLDQVDRSAMTRQRLRLRLPDVLDAGRTQMKEILDVAGN